CQCAVPAADPCPGARRPQRQHSRRAPRARSPLTPFEEHTMTRTQRPSAWFDPLVSRTRTLRALCALLLIGVAGVAQAQWPEKPIRVVLGVAPGGGTDLMARIYAQP